MPIKKGTVTIASSTPVTEWGSVEGTLSDQADLKNALDLKANLLSPAFTGIPTVPTASEGTDTNQIASTKFVNTAIETAMEEVDPLPDQTGQNGKFLKTNGTDSLWANIPAELPSQTGNAGKVLSTNGTTPSWIEYTPPTNVEIDEVTINKNASDELEAIGVIDKNSGNAKYDWVGTYAQWEAGRNNNSIPNDWICYITDDIHDTIVSHNIGDIFYSIRVENAINGAVVCDGSSYSIADYSLGNESIKNLLDNGKLPYVSIATFDSTITSKGSCRCFGYDGGSTFKVPKLNDVFVECGTANSANEFIDAGLPNITGQIGNNSGQGFPTFTAPSSGALYDVSTTYNRGTNNVASAGTTVALDASRSSSIYGNSNTVQPNAVKYRAFIQLASGTTETALQTVSTYADDVNDLKEEIKETLQYKHITNCITEIPQDIKVELNNGILTVKAGSKIYPSYSPYTPIILETDKSMDVGYGSPGLVFYDISNDTLFSLDNGNIYSSGTPYVGLVYEGGRLWRYNNRTQISNQISLSLCTITQSNNVITSINHIFNGFGYFGSTVFALPGVKGLAPNGRNPDGTLKNKVINETSVHTFTMVGSNEDVYSTFYLDENGIFAEWWRHDDIISESLPSGEYNHVYIPSKNEFWVCQTGDYWQCFDAKLCTVHRINGVVQSIEQTQPFRALSWNDKEDISSWSMPSGKWLDISSSIPIDGVGHTYTAPTNGYIFVSKRCAINNEYLGAYDDDFYTHYEVWGQSGNQINFFVPLKRGQSIIIRGTASGADFIARFMYAEGEI